MPSFILQEAKKIVYITGIFDPMFKSTGWESSTFCFRLFLSWRSTIIFSSIIFSCFSARFLSILMFSSAVDIFAFSAFWEFTESTSILDSLSRNSLIYSSVGCAWFDDLFGSISNSFFFQKRFFFQERKCPNRSRKWIFTFIIWIYHLYCSFLIFILGIFFNISITIGFYFG